MKNNSVRPTFEEFLVVTRSEFGFLLDFGFREVSLPDRKFLNQFQVRFSNGKLVLIIEGINWGQNTDIYFEDSDEVKIPWILFVPFEQRPGQKEKASSVGQLSQIRAVAPCINEFCQDILSGDMDRFYDRSAAWKHYLNPNPDKHGPRKLP